MGPTSSFFTADCGAAFCGVSWDKLLCWGQHRSNMPLSRSVATLPTPAPLVHLVPSFWSWLVSVLETLRTQCPLLISLDFL